MSKIAFIFFFVSFMYTPVVSWAENWKGIPNTHDVYYDEGSIERLQNKVKVETRIQITSDGNMTHGGGYQATVVFDCNNQTVKAVHINQTMWGMPNPPIIAMCSDDKEKEVLGTKYKDLYQLVCTHQQQAPTTHSK